MRERERKREREKKRKRKRKRERARKEKSPPHSGPGEMRPFQSPSLSHELLEGHPRHELWRYLHCRSLLVLEADCVCVVKTLW